MLTFFLSEEALIRTFNNRVVVVVLKEKILYLYFPLYYSVPLLDHLWKDAHLLQPFFFSRAVEHLSG